MAEIEDLVEAFGQLAEAAGWTMSYVERGGSDKVGFVFERNTSPYGAASSRHRAKQRITVLSDLMTQQVLAAQRQSPQSQRILRGESGGFPADPDL